MEFRQDLIYSVPQYGNIRRGLRTLGEFKEIQLESGEMIWNGELFVLPEFRKYGIGTELVEELFTVAKESGG